MHSTTSKTMYLDTTDSRRVAQCQSRYNDADSYSAKHHYPSPIISWIEDVSSFGDASFSPVTEYVDEQERSSVGHSSTSSNLRDMQIVRSRSFLTLS
jgi:STAM-binding protein